MYSFTRLTSPDTLTKAFSLDDQGQLVKSTGAQMSRGTATRVRASTLAEFVEFIETLGPNEVLTYGVTEHESVDIASQRRLRDDPEKHSGAITRTRDNFHWPRGGAIWFLDYDPRGDETPLDAEQLRTKLIEVCPALVDAPMAITSSASSYIYNGDECLVGPRGLHAYLPVTSGADIPRAGLALYDRSWLAGLGFCVVDAAGRALARSIIDPAVWQPERLDFGNGAHCTAPLQQRRPPAAVWNAGASAFDTRQVVSLDKDERLEFNRIAQQARVAVAGECATTRKARLDAAPDENARDALRAALEDNRLGPGFVLYPDGVDASTVTVGELLSNLKTWHGVEFADPVDPMYRNDPRIAVAKLTGVSRPYIYSHAHGGIRYALVREPVLLEYVRGDEAAAADRCLEALAAEGQTFRYAGAAAQISDSKLAVLEPDYFAREVARAVAFVKRVRDPNEEGNGALHRISVPPTVSRYAYATAKFANALPELRGVISAPTLRADGTVLDDPGYSAADKLYYAADDAAPRIPEQPTAEQVRAALTMLRRPFRDFPFDNDVSRSVCLAAILTAAIRRTISVAPLTLIAAPVAGTGKTMLATMLAIIAGDEAAATPPPASDEEAHKLIVSAFRAGRNALLWDNFTSDIEGRALAVLASAAAYSGRTLGRSEEASYPNGLLVVLTGNNVKPLGDLGRRTMTVGLDPQCENPYERVFDFDPVQMIADARLRYVAAALVVVRGYLTHGQPDNRRVLGGFEAWDRLVRQSVLWAGREFPDIWGAGDPLDSVRSNVEEDESKSLLRRCADVMSAAFGHEPKTCREIYTSAQGMDIVGAHQLREWLDELSAGRLKTDPVKFLGQYLSTARNRVVDGRVLRMWKRRDDVWLYAWKNLNGAEAPPAEITAPVDAQIERAVDEFAQPTLSVPTAPVTTTPATTTPVPATVAPSDEWLALETPQHPRFIVRKIPEANRSRLCEEVTRRGGVVSQNGAGLLVSGEEKILRALFGKYRATFSPFAH